MHDEQPCVAVSSRPGNETHRLLVWLKLGRIRRPLRGLQLGGRQHSLIGRHVRAAHHLADEFIAALAALLDKARLAGPRAPLRRWPAARHAVASISAAVTRLAGRDELRAPPRLLGGLGGGRFRRLHLLVVLFLLVILEVVQPVLLPDRLITRARLVRTGVLSELAPRRLEVVILLRAVGRSVVGIEWLLLLLLLLRVACVPPRVWVH